MRRRATILVIVSAWAVTAAACAGETSTSTTSVSTDTTSDAPSTTAAPGTTGAPSTTSGAPTGEPIVVGGTLALTGPLGPTGVIHQIAGQLYVDRLNESTGLLGQPVEWNLVDDASDGARIAELYEQLISQDQVDLIIGPYATPNILAAMPVAERHGYVLPQHTSVLAPAMTYACQFPGWSIGPEPNVFIPNQLADALDSLDGAVSTVALVTNEGGSTSFVSYGSAEDPDVPATDTILPERGYEIVVDIPYPIGNTEWGSVATDIQNADPDIVVVNGLGLEANGLIEAMDQLGFDPPMMFALFPAPGAVLSLGELADGVISVSIFEPNEPILAEMDPVVREITEEFSARVEEAGLPYTAFETQAAASWNTWEILTQGVEGAGSLDQQAICDYLHQNGADLTFSGHVDFDPEVNNFWPTTQVLKQVQGGDWIVVWPEDRAVSPLQGPTG